MQLSQSGLQQVIKKNQIKVQKLEAFLFTSEYHRLPNVVQSAIYNDMVATDWQVRSDKAILAKIQELDAAVIAD